MRLLAILLLLVGCAHRPPKATPYDAWYACIQEAKEHGRFVDDELGGYRECADRLPVQGPQERCCWVLGWEMHDADRERWTTWLDCYAETGGRCWDE